MLRWILRAIAGLLCCAISGCVTTDAAGRSYLHHFGYARILIDSGDEDEAGHAVGGDRIKGPGASDVQLSDSRLFGFWIGPETGFGYRHQVRATTPRRCHLAIHAQDQQQLEQFISLLQSTGINGENVCAVPLSF